MAEPNWNDAALPQRLGVGEFRRNLSAVLREARHGRSFLVTEQDEVLAEIHPPSTPSVTRRRPGALRGRITMAEDFDALPADLLAVLEGGREGSCE